MERLAHKWHDTVHWAIRRTFHNFLRKNFITFNCKISMAIAFVFPPRRTDPVFFGPFSLQPLIRRPLIKRRRMSSTDGQLRTGSRHGLLQRV